MTVYVYIRSRSPRECALYCPGERELQEFLASIGERAVRSTRICSDLSACNIPFKRGADAVLAGGQRINFKGVQGLLRASAFSDEFNQRRWQRFYERLENP